MLIERVAWSAEAEAAMQNPAGATCLPYLRSEVLHGISKLWRCTDGSSVAHIVTRLDRNPDELVVAYCEGRDVHKFAGAFIHAAHVRGIPLRVHTTQPGVARLLRRYGLRVQEFVLRSTP